nr:hypothetical protein VIGAN_09190200 [Ipomoea batatas]
MSSVANEKTGETLIAVAVHALPLTDKEKRSVVEGFPPVTLSPNVAACTAGDRGKPRERKDRHSSARGHSNAQTEEVEATSIVETEFSGDQDETSNPSAEPSTDRLENTPAEDVTPDADDSTEFSSSNDSMVVLGNQTLPSPREDEASRTKDELNSTPAAQVDPTFEAEINLGTSSSSSRGENRDAPPGILAKENKSHFKTIKKAIRRTKKVVDETKACVTKDLSSAKTFVDTQLASTSRENIREFVAEIKSFAKIHIVDMSMAATLIKELSTKSYDISKYIDEHITHMVNIYNRLKGLMVELCERVPRRSQVRKPMLLT